MRFENNNKEVIKRITKRALMKNKVRNIFAVMAILLTTFMISSIFSIGISFVENYKTMNLRLQGNTATAVLPNPTESQIRKIEALNLVDSMGYEIRVGKVDLESLTKNRTTIDIKYSDNENFQKQIMPCVGELEGSYPTEDNQIMASKRALMFLGKPDAKIGDELEIPCKINGKTTNKRFQLSGYFTTYGIVLDKGYLYVSQRFVEQNQLSLEKNGVLLMTIKQALKNTAPGILDKEISLQDKQMFSYTYDRTEDLSSTAFITAILITIIALFIVLSGYLLIYNIIYISVTKDTHFYGLLKTIGTSPKQLKSIVKGQILRLSMIGIPAGLLLGALVSFVIVPRVLLTFFDQARASAMPGEVSFHPMIFIAAALFSLFTVTLSCRRPAKIAGSISPAEALRYSGSKLKKQKKNRNTTNGGKLYKMAWYNVFRERKRAVVVFLSLFMGIITFLSVNTFLGSLRVENFINRYVKNDFVLQNIEANENKIGNDLVRQIKAMDGVNKVTVAMSSHLQLEMNDDILLPALKECFQRFGMADSQLQEYLKGVKENPEMLSASVIGIDDETIESFNKEAEEKIDIAAFRSGRLALLSAWYYGENAQNIKGDLTIKNKKNNGSQAFPVAVVTGDHNWLPSGLAAPLGVPTIYISNSAIKKLDPAAVNYMVQIDVDSRYEAQVKAELKSISGSRGLLLEARSDVSDEFKNAQMTMAILGGGISAILILIGILNFINVMITGVNVRLKELAVMESIGMTKKQIKRMLTFEGFYYAGITTLFIFTIGMAIIYGIAQLSKQIADYAVFVFPAVPLAVLLVLIFLVCLLVPGIVFRQSSKSSVTERIREIEN